MTTYKYLSSDVVAVIDDDGISRMSGSISIVPEGVEIFPMDVSDIQALKWDAIKAERDRRTVNGVHTAGNWFHSDTFSRTQQLGLVMMGASMPSGIMWKTMDQTFVEMTPALAGQIFQATAGSDALLFGTAEAKHAEMLALDDPTNYDVMAGWPETHA